MSDAASDFTNRLSALTLEEKASLCLGSAFLVHGASGTPGDTAESWSRTVRTACAPNRGKATTWARGQRARDVLPYSLSARLLLEFRALPNDRCGARQGGEEARRLGGAWAGRSI